MDDLSGRSPDYCQGYDAGLKNQAEEVDRLKKLAHLLQMDNAFPLGGSPMSEEDMDWLRLQPECKDEDK